MYTVGQNLNLLIWSSIYIITLSISSQKWTVLPLVDNVKDDSYGYEVHVYTGLKTNAGTTSKVDFILAGTEGDTGTRLMEDCQRKVSLSQVY